MIKLKNLFSFLVIFCFFCSCSCHTKRVVKKVGIDPTWYKLNMEELNTQINGFIEELLLEIAKKTDYEFEKIKANWDDILEGLEEGKFDVIISPLGKYNFTEDKFDFSSYFLTTGPVIVYPAENKAFSSNKLNGKMVGFLNESDVNILLTKYPDVLVQNYYSIPMLLNAIMTEELSAGVVDKLQAYLYLNDIYQNKLKMTKTLSEEGLRFVTKKNEEKYLLNRLNRIIASKKKNKSLEKLKEKWNLL